MNGPSEREFDEKFHILQAPKLLVEDLRYYRIICELRGAAVVVAYLDIDDFKGFNTKYGEVAVDRRVLPRFMRTVEAHLFQHGFAYRYGGDEYMILLPNLSKALAISFLESLQHAIARIGYPGVEEKITVSIGFCYVDGDSPFTDRELETLANRAMRVAKSNGKNRIATYATDDFSDEDLILVRPVEVPN
jgi:diguanylate cyclase (GGDEF)-like protein